MEKHSTTSSKGAIRKSINRNLEVPLKVSQNRRSVTIHPLATATSSKSLENKRKTIGNLSSYDSSCKKYHEPELHSTLNLLQKMQNLELRSKPSVIDLTPRSKADIAQKVTKRLNIHPDKSVFTDLIPINVNDSILIPEFAKTKKQSLRKKYYQSDERKDQIPELADFLSPIKRLELTIPLYDKPDVFEKPSDSNFEEIHNIITKYHPSYLTE